MNRFTSPKPFLDAALAAFPSNCRPAAIAAARELLHGAPADIASLLSRLRRFVDSSETSLPIHDFAEVAQNHPVRLHAVRGKSGPSAIISTPSKKSFFLGLHR
jgi:hypothetical protein